VVILLYFSAYLTALTCVVWCVVPYPGNRIGADTLICSKVTNIDFAK